MGTAPYSSALHEQEEVVRGDRASNVVRRGVAPASDGRDQHARVHGMVCVLPSRGVSLRCVSMVRRGAALLKFDEQFWSQIGRKIRWAMRKDRALLSRVKSERENLYGTKHKPNFPSPLVWLHTLWEQTSPPPHQPFAPQVHYQVANWIESLRRLGLSKEETMEVLSQDDFRVGQFERQGKDYANIPGEDLRKLGEAFRLTIGSLPGSVKNLSEMGRTLKWVSRQRTVPMARLKGERVRARKSEGA